MKRIVAFLIIVCIMFMTSTLTSAQTQMSASSSQVTLSAKGSSDNSGWLTVNPALSVGYLWDRPGTEYTLRARGAGIGGVTGRLYDYKSSEAIYLAGRLPFTFGKRLEATLSASWAIPVGSSDVKEYDFFGGTNLGGRTWEAETNWLTGDLQVSYAIIKDLHILKALAPVVGLRYDYWKTKYDDPHYVSPRFAVAAPTDTAKFYTSALLPYIGFTATIGGLKIGAFGGDLKLGAIGGWTAWGKVKHYETRDAVGPRHDTFKGDLDGSGRLFDFGEFFGEYTVFSLALSQRIQGSLSLFLKYNLFKAYGKLDGTRWTSGERDTFDFNIDRSSTAVGICAAFKF
jgi:hypothetical protein